MADGKLRFLSPKGSGTGKLPKTGSTIKTEPTKSTKRAGEKKCMRIKRTGTDGRNRVSGGKGRNEVRNN